MTGEDTRMTAEELQKLYHESISFKLYVDKVCRSSGVSKGRAFQNKIVQSYAQYVLKDQDSYAKEDAQREYRQNYGC